MRKVIRHMRRKLVKCMMFLTGNGAASDLRRGGGSAATGTTVTAEAYQEIVSTYSIDASIPDYADYLAAAPGERPDTPIVIDAAEYVRYEDAGEAAEPQVLDNYAGAEGASLLTGEEALVEYAFHVPQSGLYDLELTYYPYEGKNSEIQRAFFIDGKLPYGELALVEFNRVWQNGDAP